MKIISNTNSKNSLSQLEVFIEQFDQEGQVLAAGNRNQIKIFDFEGRSITIKAFKIPNLVNKIAYKFFRKSKAQRSYEYAQALLSKGILTPHPLAYAIDDKGIFFGASYYFCDYIAADLTYRKLIEEENYPNRTEILKAFTRFTYKMHEQGIHFLDHSPGNTLIVKKESGYDFYLVDLNRMEFGSLDFNTRMENFSRLTPKKEMIDIMATEYAQLGNYDLEETKALMWAKAEAFQEKFWRKKAIKKKLKFWKK
ncbi:Kdo domain containing protein [Leeuwenhoekiella sp. W20_SRS_FM14]|uniref:Kdo domain containing protein n=1 Tax=Leeuwenhoekiella sp. W20_SRS_FM14 TaxID=3240270 RepID=UPI003F95DF62